MAEQLLSFLMSVPSKDFKQAIDLNTNLEIMHVRKFNDEEVGFTDSTLV